jgi:anti-sigma factor ChrR (cupin superfamily)
VQELERSKEAYDEVQRAKVMLNNEDKARHVRGLVERGMKLGKQVWKEKGPTAESLAEVQSKECNEFLLKLS